MGFKENIKHKFGEAETGREKCSLCENCIPADVDRISFPYKGRYSDGYNRICGYCILKAAKIVKKAPIKEWEKKLFAKEI